MREFPHSAPAAVAGLALALAACAETGWVRPGANAETLREDLGNCQALAYDRISRSSQPAPPATLDRRFGAELDGPVRPMETRIREQQLVDACMREKGYAVAPAAR